MPSRKKQSKEETFKATGETLVRKVKQLIKAGNIRKITIKNKNGDSILVIPLTWVVVGAAIAPVIAAVGAVAAMIGECSITVQKK